MEIVLATKNEGKLREFHNLLAGFKIIVKSLADFPEISDIKEDGNTFLENARKKARTVLESTGKWALADDSGLEVEALGGRPGVNSARYAGKQGDYKANNEKLLGEMESVPDGKRGARFVCTLVLMSPYGKEWVTTGKCEGEITRELKGTGGFGFDPVFFVKGEGKTMAELPMEVKNRISHRGRALANLREILVEILG